MTNDRLSPELGVRRFTYEPGARMPFGHRHRVQEEVYVVVAGSGRAKLDEPVAEFECWDVLRVVPAVVRSFEAGPEGLDLIRIGGQKPKGKDTERFPTSGTDGSAVRALDRHGHCPTSTMRSIHS